MRWPERGLPEPRDPPRVSRVPLSWHPLLPAAPATPASDWPTPDHSFPLAPARPQHARSRTLPAIPASCSSNLDQLWMPAPERPRSARRRTPPGEPALCWTMLRSNVPPHLPRPAHPTSRAVAPESHPRPLTRRSLRDLAPPQHATQLDFEAALPPGPPPQHLCVPPRPTPPTFGVSA